MPGAREPREEYWYRINRVIDHIETHLDEELRLDQLARVACFSPYHFHRLFSAMMGEPLGQFIQRVRLERAANQLVGNPRTSITTIALNAGFSGSATFARAFREAFGMSASQWRDGGHLEWSKMGKPLRKAGKAGPRSPVDDALRSQENRRNAMHEKTKSTLQYEVEVTDRPELNVAYVRHVGEYRGQPEVFEGLFGRLMGWAGPRGLCRFPETQVVCVYHDNPEVTPDDKLRVSACITVPAGTPVDGEIGAMTVPGGRFAVGHFELTSPDQYGDAWAALMGEWLPQSGFQPDDRLCYEHCLNNPAEDPAGRILVDIHVPIRPL
jgi:AraC family transcriptional regulator